jgi:hypothetical protein
VLACTIALAGCKPPTVTAVRADVGFEAGCSITVDVTGAPPSTTFGVGMYTTGSPVDIGKLTSNTAGDINKTLSYANQGLPHVYSNLYVEIYTIRSGQFGVGLASAKVTISVCLPVGLAA